MIPGDEVWLNHLCLDIIAPSSKWRVGEIIKSTNTLRSRLPSSLFSGLSYLYISPLFTLSALSISFMG